MARFHTTNEGDIPYSAEEEAARDAEETQWLAERAERNRMQFREQRASEYPPTADYLDGIVKGDQAQVQAYIDACLAVKAKYPKPTE